MTFDNTVAAPRVRREGSLGILGHLDSLTYDFEREGKQVSCVLVYAEPNPSDDTYHSVVAADSGHEGIACVDDTARASLLAMSVFERSGDPGALSLAKRWLTFVEYMQYSDGSFANFISNSAGIRNASGPTSVRGGYAWSMRAIWSLARAYRVCGDINYRDRIEDCRLAPTDDMKVNAVLALADMELYRRDPDSGLRSRIETRVHLIAAASEDGYFQDRPGTDKISLWGYHQLHAVAAAIRLLGLTDLIPSCQRTVETLIEPDVQAQFWHAFPSQQKRGVCAYDVAPIVQGLAELYRATELQRYRHLALDGCAWFYGRNDARTTMYDPTTGRCRDGIAEGIASLNVGAESSIEAGFAEIDRRDLLLLP